MLSDEQRLHARTDNKTRGVALTTEVNKVIPKPGPRKTTAIERRRKTARLTEGCSVYRGRKNCT
jgi:hypothetical protein